MMMVTRCICECWELPSLWAFGTHGEKALSDAMRHEFPHAVHLICFRHCHGNIMAKLSELGFPQDLSQQIYTGRPVWKEIFRRVCGGFSWCKGWVRNIGCTGQQVEGSRLSTSRFVQWFRTYKLKVFTAVIATSGSRSCWAWYPPDKFTSESSNAVLTTKLNYKCSELPEFTQSVLKLS